MMIESLSMSIFFSRLIGMPTDHSDNGNNLDHERKRKRIDDKISKSGGKRPRWCDKESRKTYTSQYFSSTQSIQLNPPPVVQVDRAPLRGKRERASINYPSSSEHDFQLAIITSIEYGC